MGDENISSQWHLDKRVPIVFIIALAIQTMTVVWWASNIENRVTNTEKIISTLPQITSHLDRMTIRMDNAERRLQGFQDRSSKASDDLLDVSREVSALREQMAATEKSVDRLLNEISEMNNLIRDFMKSGGANR